MEIANADLRRASKSLADAPHRRRPKQLEKENSKLKRQVADLTLDKTLLQDALRRKWNNLPVAARLSGTARTSSRVRNVARC